jgi:hypothetical protein
MGAWIHGTDEFLLALQGLFCAYIWNLRQSIFGWFISQRPKAGPQNENLFIL